MSGEIIACKQVQQACARQLDDLGRPKFKYVFDVSKANRACQFIELLPHIKGALAGQKITLEPWQIFIITTIFGWVDDAGHRRFRTVYIEVGRKNAKSTLASGIALYCLIADGEAGAEVYSAATTREQARIVWRDAKRMVDKTPGLRRRFDVATSAHAIYSENSASTFQALSRDSGGNLDGLNVHCAVIDEFHAHKTRDVFDVIETATGARTQALIVLITTAGFNRSGICYEIRKYVIRILDNSIQDDSYFAIIYTLDDDDDWTDSKNWIKANPNINVSVSHDDIERGAHKAMRVTSAQNNFLTKRLNVWVNADSTWMNPIEWSKCGNSTLHLDQFSGRKCWLGIDLANKLDFACVAFVFEGDYPGTYVIFVKHYLPELTIEESENSQISGWFEDGHIIESPGAMMDQNIIETDIKEAAGMFQIAEVGYDNWQANHLAMELMKEGITMVEVRPTIQNFSAPMKELEALVKADKIRHAACPVLDWMISNVVCHTDAKDNIYPRKEDAKNKIDGVIAILMAMNRALANAPEPCTEFFVSL